MNEPLDDGHLMDRWVAFELYCEARDIDPDSPEGQKLWEDGPPDDY